MTNSHHLPIRNCAFALLLILSTLGYVLAQGQASKSAAEDPERRRALELYDQNNFVDAMPLLESLAAKNPSDVVVLERWAFSMMGYATTLSDMEARKKVRMRARTIALQAEDHGDDSNLLKTILESLPEDGSDPTYSNRKELDEIMLRADADFARGELDRAREGYMRALSLEPNYYVAALFAGKVLYKQDKLGSAGEWYARAVQIDPNSETAYRYWGDALMAEGKTDEARSKFIEAVIAEPYSNRSRMGLTQWAGRTHVKLNYLKLQYKSAVKTENDRTTITFITPNGSMRGKEVQLGMAAWIVYSGNRVSWKKEKFKKEFPNEPKYRRTLREETAGLDLMVSVISELKEKRKVEDTLSPDLAELVQIKRQGWLEPFVLLNRADAEIAQDYDAYRAANREKIRSYLNEYVVPKTPAK